MRLAGRPGVSKVLYPGPGTYTLTAYVAVHGSDGLSYLKSYFDANGTMQRTVELTTAIADGPRLVGTASRLDDASRVLTVTNEGNETATAVSVRISSGGFSSDAPKWTDDKRCKTDEPFNQFVVCTLGDLAAGASQKVALKAEANNTCYKDGLYWSYEAKNSSQLDETLCPRRRF
ncbi:hypothetical protein [Streptomyces sp. ISL-94]|uniref:hypothetical protein n=1 Tax=Streptomyces sp. ISL-94 TaxID=2819190 RepID=UPI001BE716FA|nr:hypothetical protein [Streptomyces sp. ISL-94]MBT2478474.1 hypothetical protein [Streptomyces sp. ISL-94]